MPTEQSPETRHFQDENGGYTGQELELECQQLLRCHGFMAILEDDHIVGEDGHEKTSLDMNINGGRADVRSITVNGPQTLRNGILSKHRQLLKYNIQNNTHYDTLLLHYHDASMWNLEKITQALECAPTIVRKFQIRRVICTINLNKATEDTLQTINQLGSLWFSLMVVTFKRLLRIQSSLNSATGIVIERHISKRSCSTVVIIHLS